MYLYVLYLAMYMYYVYPGMYICVWLYASCQAAVCTPAGDARHTADVPSDASARYLTHTHTHEYVYGQGYTKIRHPY